MAPKKFQNDPSETQTPPQTPPQTQKPEAAPLDLEAVFRDAVASGEIDGDVVMVDEQGIEVKDAQPRKTIFDV